MNLTIDTRLALNDGNSIPQLGLGVWKTPNGKQCETAVLAALEKGYRHIDTAAIYGNEESVGAALAKSGIGREQIFVTTKLWNEEHHDPTEALQNSLKRLTLDYVDLYLIHFPVRARNKSWSVLEKLHASSAARSIGVSNFTIRHLNELLPQTKTVPAANQVEFHPFLNQRDLLQYCSEKHIVVEAYSPLTHGKRLNDPHVLEIGKKYGKSAAQILIRWALQHGMVVLPKSTHPERIAENANVYDFNISVAEMSRLDALDENLRTCWDPTDAP